MALVVVLCLQFAFGLINASELTIPQFPPYYVEHNFSQRVNHFNSADNRRYNQRFLLNDTFFKQNTNPIIFYTGRIPTMP